MFFSEEKNQKTFASAQAYISGAWPENGEFAVATIRNVTLSAAFLPTIAPRRAGVVKDAARRFAVAFGHP
jgi:hypothetical protein